MFIFTLKAELTHEHLHENPFKNERIYDYEPQQFEIENEKILVELQSNFVIIISNLIFENDNEARSKVYSILDIICQAISFFLQRQNYSISEYRPTLSYRKENVEIKGKIPIQQQPETCKDENGNNITRYYYTDYSFDYCTGVKREEKLNLPNISLIVNKNLNESVPNFMPTQFLKHCKLEM